MKTNFVGQYCIIRSDRAGVFAGTVSEVDGQTVVLTDARRLWYWSGAASLSQMAVDGVKIPESCKFTMPVDTIAIFGVIEIIPATVTAMTSIKGVPVWKIK